MSKLKVVVVSGNLGSPSKTLILAEQILETLKRQANVQKEIHQLAELAPLIGPARHPGELGDFAQAALLSIASADILIAVTPVYKGSYTGLFKHLFDFLDPQALNETPVILGATGGGDKHALIIEHQLRPLFGFFGALTVPSGIYASEQNYDGSRFSDPAILERIEAAARQALAAARSRAERDRQAKAA
ncbi:MAG: FMN reductase [Methylococcaceae bacterium]|nr:FMN reductase [Methylococcaceae bacterium]